MKMMRPNKGAKIRLMRFSSGKQWACPRSTPFPEPHTYCFSNFQGCASWRKKICETMPKTGTKQCGAHKKKMVENKCWNGKTKPSAWLSGRAAHCARWSVLPRNHETDAEPDPDRDPDLDMVRLYASARNAFVFFLARAKIYSATRS